MILSHLCRKQYKTCREAITCKSNSNCESSMEEVEEEGGSKLPKETTLGLQRSTIANWL